MRPYRKNPDFIDTKTYYINTATKPLIFFNLKCDAINLTAKLIGYSLTGTYSENSRDFGDGVVRNEYLPDTYTFATSGLYAVKNTVCYGNGCFVSKAKTAHDY